MSEESPEISGDLNNGSMFASGRRNLELGYWGKRYIFTHCHFVQFEFCKIMHAFNYLFKTRDNYVNKYIKGIGTFGKTYRHFWVVMTEEGGAAAGI